MYLTSIWWLFMIISSMSERFEDHSRTPEGEMCLINWSHRGLVSWATKTWRGLVPRSSPVTYRMSKAHADCILGLFIYWSFVKKLRGIPVPRTLPRHNVWDKVNMSWPEREIHYRDRPMKCHFERTIGQINAVRSAYGRNRLDLDSLFRGRLDQLQLLDTSTTRKYEANRISPDCARDST